MKRLPNMTMAMTCALLGCIPSTIKLVAEALRVRVTGRDLALDVGGSDSIRTLIDSLEAEAIAGNTRAFASLGSMHDVLDALDEIEAAAQSELN